MPRLLLVLAAGLLTALGPVQGQEVAPAACVGGMAGTFPCNGIDLVATLTPQQMGAPTAGSCGAYPNLCANEVWGWVDPQTGKRYAIQGLPNGTAFVDVTVPEAPVYVGRLPTAAASSTWRTLRVYADHVFVGSEAGGHGIQVFDLRRLRTVTSPPQTFAHDARYTGNGNAHTLHINEATGFLYIAGSTSGSAGCSGGGLHIVDVRTPTAPVFAGCFGADGYTHETQCIVYDGPDTDYTGREICAAYNEDTVTFVDVTNKAAPALISRGLYPNDGYTHQGWFTDDRRYVLVNDEFDPANPGTRTIVMEVADLDNPTFRFDYHGPLRTYAHNLYVRGRYAYLSNYTGGLHVLDISGIASNQLMEVASFDTYPEGNPMQYAGQWMSYPFFDDGLVLASDGRNGLFILRPTGLSVAGEPAPLAPAGSAHLSAPVPNPTTGRTRVDLRVGEGQRVRAEAFDALGRRVAVVFEGMVTPGAPAHLLFDAAGLPSGAYVVRVTGEAFVASTRVTVVR